ncbi:MAG: hypothetical protein FWC57_00255 [Endomicrobia bacterium]|nr:hypothetical protein [Endomicrobiia bacterium]
MLKKVSVLVCVAFVLGVLSLGQVQAQGNSSADGGPACSAMMKDGDAMKDMKEQMSARKEKMEAMKKDHMEYQKKLDGFVDQYNKTKGAKQDAVKAQIKDLISAQTDKELAAKKELIAEQKARIESFEKKTADIEANKAKYVDDKVALVTSKEGQEKMKEMRERRGRMKGDRRARTAETAPAATTANTK